VKQKIREIIFLQIISGAGISTLTNTPQIRLFLKIELKPLDITLLKKHTDFGRQAK
jgi:hypothetical protein